MGWRDNDEPVEVDYDEYVERADTDMACLYIIDGEECWFPKSLHTRDDDPKRKVIWVQQWFAEKEGYV